MKLSVFSSAAVVAAAAFSGVLVLAPVGANADTDGAPAPSPAVQAALESYPTVASLATAFANAAPDAVIMLSQDLTGVASDPAVSVRDATPITLDLNGHTLKLTRDDLRAAIGVPPSSKLTITDSTIDHTGHLIVDAGAGAGIGGSALGHPGPAPGFGSIVIAGAKVDATSRNGAGIGAVEDGGSGGDITITYNTVSNFNFGSQVTATSQQGAGIGGAIFSQWQGSVTITGQSTVEATGGFASPGIGGGPDGMIGTITINDAYVTATGNGGAAGIGGGGGAHGPLPPITISDGNVEATGGPTGTGIGAGDRGDGEEVPLRLKITGQSVVTPLSTGGVAIDLSVQGSQLAIDKSELWLPSGNSITIPPGTTVVNDGGTIVVRGTIANHGTIQNVNGGKVDAPQNVSDNNTTIKWDGNGGTAPVAETGPIFARTLDDAGDVTFPLPVRDGYVYVGWYPRTDGGTRLTTTTDLGGGGPKTITYYAAWALPGSVGDPSTAGSGTTQTSSTGSGSGSATLAATGSGIAPWAPIGGTALAIGIALSATAAAAVRLRGGGSRQGNRRARPGSR
ncbi:InlB B-repeat-containing protein [Herbiconiux sp. P16]|uniref:InlB B-repeat-containing protein n=1 Tax=Herbiconiux wuyangfengii TaxID=3342794 RepID=UPI0035B93D3A